MFFFVLFCVIAPIVVCVLIWCCVAGALGASFRNSRPTTTVTTTPATVVATPTVVTATSQTTAVSQSQCVCVHAGAHPIMQLTLATHAQKDYGTCHIKAARYFYTRPTNYTIQLWVCPHTYAYRYSFSHNSAEGFALHCFHIMCFSFSITYTLCVHTFIFMTCVSE